MTRRRAWSGSRKKRQKVEECTRPAGGNGAMPRPFTAVSGGRHDPGNSQGGQSSLSERIRFAAKTRRANVEQGARSNPSLLLRSCARSSARSSALSMLGAMRSVRDVGDGARLPPHRAAPCVEEQMIATARGPHRKPVTNHCSGFFPQRQDALSSSLAGDADGIEVRVPATGPGATTLRRRGAAVPS